jgi:lia operon protein LiaG
MRFPILPCAVLAAAPPALAAQQAERYTLDQGPAAVYNLVGNLRVEPGEGRITVQVSRAGADAGKLRIGQGEIRGRSTLRIVYPGDRIRSGKPEDHGSTQLRVRDDGTFGGDDHDHDEDHGRQDWDDGRRVTIGSAGLDARADLIVRVPKGERVSVHLAVGAVTVANVDGDLKVRTESAPVTASGSRGSLGVEVGAGEVRITNARGELDVDTGSGSVEVTGFSGTNLSVDTGSGDVTGSDLTADDLDVDTGSGEIRLASVTSPRLSLETGSGGITAELRRDVASLEVETGSGDVAIRAPSSLGAEVEVQTASGDIDTDFPLQVTRGGRDHMVGTVGDGKGTIAIETGSGGIRLMKAD